MYASWEVTYTVAGRVRNHHVKLNLRIEKLHVRFRELERAREVGVNTGNGFVVEMLV